MSRPRLLSRAAIALAVSLGCATVLTSTSIAGPNANGTLIVHYFAGGIFCVDDPPCVLAENMDPLLSCADGLTNVPEDTPALFSVYAAFPETDGPRVSGITFGIDYPEPVFVLAYESCADFELPTGDWPNPGAGTAVTWTSAQTSTLTHVYAFSGYSYSFYGADQSFDLIPHPSQGGFFADDDVPSNLDPIVDYGVLGFGNNPGYLPCPAIPMDGACCLPDCSCIVTTRNECPGEFYGEGTSCDPNPCSCPAMGACCIDIPECTLLTELECLDQGGIYLGDDLPCEPNPCDFGSPVEAASWGKIKANYRR
ncbi:MAG: hypothetical protein R3E97_02920 [Candidatus Eisenbacteria bacterium]